MDLRQSLAVNGMLVDTVVDQQARLNQFAELAEKQQKQIEDLTAQLEQYLPKTVEGA